MDLGNERLERCIHAKKAVSNKRSNTEQCFICNKERNGLGEKMNWKDNLQREYSFILDCFPNEPGPKETILPYNPALVKELEVKKADIMIGRPTDVLLPIVKLYLM